MGAEVAARYAGAFPTAYQEEVSAKDAIMDIGELRALPAQAPALGLQLRSGDATRRALHLRLYRRGDPLAMSDLLPMLENFDLRVQNERPYRIASDANPGLWIQDLEVTHAGGQTLDPGAVGARFEQAFFAVWNGQAESDGFNRLVLAAGLDWRQAMVLRAVCRYLLQTGLPFSQRYMESVLSRQPFIAQRLSRLFEARFDPALAAAARNTRVRALGREIDDALDKVTGRDDDRIIRAFRSVITATLRTNHYQRDATGAHKKYLSFKLEPRSIPELPKPRPMFEIWVYSPRVEGVHLRMGMVARGGLRWSDRREDFRTEILGLMKAQNVKNTVIVPVGAKGGFVPRQLPASGREEIQREGTECYRIFIRALLDITDNVVDGKVVPPAEVVRYDGDDPYLVVAADKGTATFSDTANALAAEYRFWLGDAFASGGSAGYDHKKMAITARGGWECVKRHFRELGIDIQSQDFTAAGIGDMAGDVFGNAMLLSRHIRLQAAFNHQHIFLDPEPDPARSFRERARLFRLPRSTWADYDRRAISKGGGVYPRDAKQIRALAAGTRAARNRRGPGKSAGDHPRDPEAASRPDLERRDRHLRQGLARGALRHRRSRQRCAARRRAGAALPGRRRRRQPGTLAARPHRVRAGRRPDQHGLRRQLRWRRLFRPRGQHQDPARRRSAAAQTDAARARPPACRDDRGSGGARAPRQLPAEPGDQPAAGEGGGPAR